MRTLLIIAIGCALALAGCGGAASPGQPAPAQVTPAQIQATPAVQQTEMPTAKPTQGGYEGY